MVLKAFLLLTFVNHEPCPMTSREYLLNQAEYCRRAAADCADRFVAQELKRLAHEFEAMAKGALSLIAPARQTA
jgi:hypothetical protein